MQKYQNIFKMTFKTYFSFENHKLFSKWFMVLVNVLLLPVHLGFLFFSILFEIMYLFIVVFRVPAEFIKTVIKEENDISAAAQFIVYLVAYPTKFAFDLLTAWQLIMLSIVYWFLQVFGLVGSLNGIQFQPFLMYAEENHSHPKTWIILSETQELFVTIGIALIIAFFFSISFIRSNLPKNELYDQVSEIIAFTIEEEDILIGYQIEEVLYIEDLNKFVYIIRHSNVNRYFEASSRSDVTRIFQEDYDNYSDNYEASSFNLAEINRRIDR